MSTKIIFRSIGTYCSRKALFRLVEMVRHFPNEYEDYKPGTNVVISAPEVIMQIHHNTNTIIKGLPSQVRADHNVEGGLYVGSTGLSFMFYYLSKNTLLAKDKQRYLENSLKYLKPALEIAAHDQTAFLMGAAGTYALATVLFKELGDDQYLHTLNAYRKLYGEFLKPKSLKYGSDEFFVGRSGYIAGALWMGRELRSSVLSNQELHDVCDIVVESGKLYAAHTNSPCPLMYHYYNTQYLGAAHGLSTILQMLISVPGYIKKDEAIANDIKVTIDYIASLQTPDGNWPSSMDEIGLPVHKLVHWCHGAPGIVYLMAKAYLVFKDHRYLEACIKAGDLVWSKGLLFKGPGICHGVAGNGYVFLLLFRLTGDQKYLYRAKMFCEFLTTDQFQRNSRLPDSPFSLYEGLAGTVCFLADVLLPDKAEFPFQDVFSEYSI